MNIQFQIAGLLILVLLFVFYKSHRPLQLYTEKAFYRVLCIMIVSLALDILSLFAIEYREVIPAFFVDFVCKSYIVTLVWETWSALIYVLTDAVPEKKYQRYTLQLLLLIIVQSILVYCHPIHIYSENGITYTYGSSTICVYLFTLTHILSTLITAGVFRKRLNPRRRFAVSLWMIIWIVGAAIQFFNNGLLIVGFAGALGVVILFVIIENPEAYLDRRFGCFNSYALTQYYEQMIKRNRRTHVFEISFANAGSWDENSTNADDVMEKMIHILSQHKRVMTFKNSNHGLLLLAEREEDLKAAGEEICNKCSEIDIFQEEAVLVFVTGIEAFPDIEEIYHFLTYVHMEHVHALGEICYVGEKEILKYQEQQLVEQEIDEALAEDRVEVYLQPIYSNKEQSFTSAEALVRIRKKDGSMLSPGLFIPVAEENGQIIQIGDRVFEKVCEFLKYSDAISAGIHYIEVNLSVVQCEDKELAKRLISILEKYEISPERINLEITETASIQSRKSLLKNMKELIEYGFSFSLDDFGKGQSNLMYIVEMPVSFVKLDYDMSKAFFSTPKAAYVVRAVINMAHGMGLKVVAEGIETKEELESICKEDVDYIQGYYYSKPIPMAEFLTFLQRNKLDNKGKTDYNVI